jgi:hypothetical protein
MNELNADRSLLEKKKKCREVVESLKSLKELGHILFNYKSLYNFPFFSLFLPLKSHSKIEYFSNFMIFFFLPLIQSRSLNQSFHIFYNCFCIKKFLKIKNDKILHNVIRKVKWISHIINRKRDVKKT